MWGSFKTADNFPGDPAITHLLQSCARHGRLILVVSLLVGLASGSLANLVKPHIDLLIFLLLVAAGVRIGPRQALGALREIKSGLLAVLTLQLVTPLLALAMLRLSGSEDPIYIALVLLMAAPAIAGSPHLVTLLGFDSRPALRLLVFGTLLLPLTILPVLFLMPEIGEFNEVLAIAFRLGGVIVGAMLVSLLIRRLLPEPTLNISSVDGISTILLAVIVLGLMAAIHTEIADDPANLIKAVGLAFGVNFGMQLIVGTLLKFVGAQSYAPSFGLIAGNRNIALFLTAIALTSTQPVLLFIACYQAPMYLTPIVMRPFYRWVAAP